MATWTAGDWVWLVFGVLWALDLFGVLDQLRERRR